MYFRTNTEQDTIAFGTILGTLVQKGDIIALQGSLAAGKTQLTKGIARGLQIDDPITSPTFTLISEYEGRLPLYHMDVYRLASVDEFLDLGVEDMLYGAGVCVIEWSEKVMTELPENTITIRLEPQADSSRLITMTNWQHTSTPLAAFEVHP